MKRRLEIARGLMTRPRVLFLDEPTIGLDPQTRMRMWDYIKEVNEEGTTIFLTTHYMDEADQLSDRISIIDFGKIITTGRSWELKNILGKDLIYLETSDNNATTARLNGLGSVKSVIPKGKGLVVLVTEDGTKLLPRFIEELRPRGSSQHGKPQKPSMDDVFVHFTGRSSGMKGGAVGPARTRAGGR